MQKEITVVIDIDSKTEEILQEFRAKHVDADTLIRLELEEFYADVITSYGEVI